MRLLMLVALIIHLSGCCGGGRGRFVNGTGEQTVEELRRRFPIADNANIRADEIARTGAASVHLVQVRGGETPHRHAAHDLTVTVLAGEGILTLDGVRRSLRQGDVAVVPRGTPHWFVRSGDDVAVALVVFTPPLDHPDTVPLDGDVDSSTGTR
jgi:quercetin dioxygenase-like cupin family protein